MRIPLELLEIVLTPHLVLAGRIVHGDQSHLIHMEPFVTQRSCQILFWLTLTVKAHGELAESTIGPLNLRAAGNAWGPN